MLSSGACPYLSSKTTNSSFSIRDCRVVAGVGISLAGKSNAAWCEAVIEGDAFTVDVAVGTPGGPQEGVVAVPYLSVVLACHLPVPCAVVLPWIAAGPMSVRWGHSAGVQRNPSAIIVFAEISTAQEIVVDIDGIVTALSDGVLPGFE